MDESVGVEMAEILAVAMASRIAKEACDRLGEDR